MQVKNSWAGRKTVNNQSIPPNTTFTEEEFKSATVLKDKKVPLLRRHQLQNGGNRKKKVFKKRTLTKLHDQTIFHLGYWRKLTRRWHHYSAHIHKVVSNWCCPRWLEIGKRVLKKGQKYTAANYCPISLTSVCCWVMETTRRKEQHLVWIAAQVQERQILWNTTHQIYWWPSQQP
jgi:hypothetical protein